MKLLIIVLSLLSERYLMHRIAQQRFSWFPAYTAKLRHMLPAQENANSNIRAVLLLLLYILPILFIVWFITGLIGGFLFGFVGFLIALFVFYYCLGKENVFYPITDPNTAPDEQSQAGQYLLRANGNLFAVIFWFLIAGVPGALLYRLLVLSKQEPTCAFLADKIVGLLDWVTVRVTLMFYLLVGNFQRGFDFFASRIIAGPEHNDELLREGGLLAARSVENESVTLPNAQRLVEHALGVFLVLIALLTLVSWL